MSSQDESSRKAKPTRKKNKMAQKKAKKKIKEPDLTPVKDPEGAASATAQGSSSLLSEKEYPGERLPSGGIRPVQ
jgi:hypothetical protein